MATKQLVALHTLLPPPECKVRLAGAVDPVRLGFNRSGYAGEKPVMGKFSEHTFRLQKRRFYSNSFAPFFYGRLIPCEGGTTIEGRFRLHPVVRIFMFFWFGFLAIFALLAPILPSHGEPEAAWGRLLFFLGPLGMVAFGIGLVKFGRWLGRNEETAILDLLKRTLDAHEVTAPTG